MAISNTTLVLKKSGISGNTPSFLANGELAINYADGKLYYKNTLGGLSAITNSLSFSNIYANGSLLLASSPNDTLNITAANSITVLANTITKTIQIGLNESLVTSFVKKTGDTMTGDLNISSANVYANNLIVTDALYSGLATRAFTPLPNLIAQFTGNTGTYVQVNAQNINPNGSADYVVTADVGDDTTFYIDMGLQGSQQYDSVNASALFPLDGYLYVQGNTGQLGGNLVIGTTSATPGLETRILAGGANNENIVLRANTYGVNVVSNLTVSGINVLDFTQLAFNQANTATTIAQSAYDYANTIPGGNDTYAQSAYAFANTVNVFTQSAYTQANTANTVAQSGYAFANTVNVFTQSAYNQANAANVLAQSGYAFANTVNTYAFSAYSFSNTVNVFTQSAYNQANSANVLAQNAYDASNTVNTYSYSSYAFANTVNVFTQSAYNFANTVNVVSQSAYNFANTVNAYVYSAYSTANSAVSNTVIIQGVDTTQNNWISSNSVFTQSAYNFANTINTYAYSAYNSSNTVNTYTFSAYAFANTVNAYAYNSNTYLQTAISTANSALKSYSDATFFTKSGGTIGGNTTISGNLTVNGNISYTGNVISQTISGNTGEFFGYASNGFNALYAGIPTGYLIEPQMITQFTANYNGYAGVNHQNINSGANSSSDIFLTPDNGTSNDGFVDIGVGSSTYNYPGYGIIKPNDGYFLVYGNTTTGGGNLIMMTGLTNDIVFAANGTTDSSVVMRVSGSGNNVVIISTVASTSNTTGALVVNGGVGIVGDVQASNIFSYGTNVISYTGAAFNKANAANVLAQSAYDKANSANVLAQNAYNASNTVNTYAFSAYSFANTVNVFTQSAYTFANTVNTYAFSAYSQANTGTTVAQAGYNQANAANVLAQSAFNQANAANILAQAAFGQANLAYTAANSAASSVNASNISTGTISTSRFPTSGVTSGTYGGSTQIPVLTVDTYGRITLASNTSVSTTINLTGTSGSGSVSGGGTLTFSSSNGVTASISGSTVTLSTPQDLRTTASPTFNVVTQTTATVTSSSSSTVSQSVLNASSATTAQTNIDSFTTTTYRSAKYMVQATQGSNYHIIELLLTANTTTAWLAQYGEVYTNTPLATFDAYISSNTVYLVANPASVSSTNYIVYRTGISLT